MEVIWLAPCNAGDPTTGPVTTELEVAPGGTGNGGATGR